MFRFGHHIKLVRALCASVLAGMMVTSLAEDYNQAIAAIEPGLFKGRVSLYTETGGRETHLFLHAAQRNSGRHTAFRFSHELSPKAIGFAGEATVTYSRRSVSLIAANGVALRFAFKDDLIKGAPSPRNLSTITIRGLARFTHRGPIDERSTPLVDVLGCPCPPRPGNCFAGSPSARSCTYGCTATSNCSISCDSGACCACSRLGSCCRCCFATRK